MLEDADAPDFSSHFTLTSGSAKGSQKAAPKLASTGKKQGKKQARDPPTQDGARKRPRGDGAATAEQRATRPKSDAGPLQPERGVLPGGSGSAARAAPRAAPRAASSDPPPPGKPELSWPFAADYNDHFETDFRAVQDILPVLQQLSKRLCKPLSELAVYDPFYCAGGVRAHYAALGITKFIHRNRDFYDDVKKGALPSYDILVTNPPYSGDHKERILEFCLRSGKPWCLLMPNYVATKAYFGQLQDAASTPPLQRPFFLTPHARYSYDHPEGTGHTESPFFSIWYVCLGAHTEGVYGSCRSRLDAAPAAGGAADQRQGGAPAGGGAAAWGVALARSVDALRQAKAVPTGKRLNPQQRKRLKQKMQPG
ncbi:hypothetical protein TSOC_002695 [Tetrabaena socialis]|uniref:Uncharacterized protein n=1 Tax=Tetrabaena socialis TaxID=47790 RepID=A0A2J8ADG8_9CHLO|nr:hypothetical protein TSOC_002695 [Tetrabaena socialis]|eukprot:PNH10568.1 hypothetical protein TSOC_002695 [Tetrabaena socialis]